MSEAITNYLKRHQFKILKVCIGVLFIWFGSLKFFPGLSPAEELAFLTIDSMTFGLLNKATILFSLASLEIILGLLLCFAPKFKYTFWLLLFHMVSTITPFFLLPELTFNGSFFKLTLVGQYIVKNIVIISAAFVLIFNENPSFSPKTENYSI